MRSPAATFRRRCGACFAWSCSAAFRPGLQAAAAVRLAQHSAQRQAYRRRRAVLEMDNWLEDSLSFGQREIN
jgi:hypothetical protein